MCEIQSVYKDINEAKLSLKHSCSSVFIFLSANNHCVCVFVGELHLKVCIILIDVAKLPFFS